jgi:hypothetical protein
MFTLNCKRRHDIAEMLLKVALKHQKSNKSINRIKIY